MCKQWGTFKFHNFEAFKNCAGHVLFPDALLKTKNGKKTQPCNQKVNDNQWSQPQKISDWHCLLWWTAGQMKPRNLNGRSLRLVSSCFLVLPFVPRKPNNVHTWLWFMGWDFRAFLNAFFPDDQTLQNVRDKLQKPTSNHVTYLCLSSGDDRNSITVHHVVLLS